LRIGERGEAAADKKFRRGVGGPTASWLQPAQRARPAASPTSARDNRIASTLRPSLQYRSGNQIFHAARASADSLITHQRSESPDWLLKNELSFKARRSALRGRDGETSGAL